MDLIRLWGCYFETGLLTQELDDVMQIHSYKLTSIPFSTYSELNPSVARLLLSHRSPLLHLGTIGLVCWLDKVPTWHKHTDWLIEHGLDLDKLRHAINYCIYRGVLRKLRSKPYIGYKHRKLLAGKS